MTNDEMTRFAVDGFAGVLVHPDDPDYDEARRVFNGSIDRYPAVVARCATADDVAAVVAMVRRDHLELTVRSGGHGVNGAALANGAVCADLRAMNGITVDPSTRTARVEAGVTWRALDTATQVHGLAVTGARVSTTGVAGFTVGGGSGWIDRSFGFACDSLFKAEVVTAEGRHVVASERENPGLFWGLRGGGGNFGIVTAFHFRLHRVGPTVLGGMLVYPAAMAGELVRFYRDFMTAAPDAVGTGLTFFTESPLDRGGATFGEPAVSIMCCHVGPLDEGEEVLRPLRTFGAPRRDLIGPIPYVAMQRLIDDRNPPGLLNHWSGDSLAELPDEAIDRLVRRATTPVSPFSRILLTYAGGAIARVPDDATAFANRNTPWSIQYRSMWRDPADTDLNIAYTKTIAAAVKPWTTGRVRLNALGDEGRGRIAAAYGPGKYARLAALKKTWDPTNLFRHNHNIPPAE